MMKKTCKFGFSFFKQLSVGFVVAAWLSGNVVLAADSQKKSTAPCDAIKVYQSQYKDSFAELAEAYGYFECQPIWSKIRSSHLKDIKKFLLSLEEHGLDPSTYPIDEITRIYSDLDDSDEQAVWDWDVRMTDFVLTLLKHMTQGRIAIRKIIADWNFPQDSTDLFAVIETLNKELKFSKTLIQLLPTDPLYQALIDERVLLQKRIQSGESWPKLTLKGKKWELGDSGEHIQNLRQRLLSEGYLKKADVNKEAAQDSFDEALVAVVKLFQTEHGLNGDGVVGQGTLDALNVSIENRLKQIDVNLERLRARKRDLGEDYVYVNIPEYQVTVVENSKPVLHLRGIVGNASWRTPVFAEEMETIVFNPTWTVPPKIARQEMLPQVKKDSTYLSKRNFRVYRTVDGKTETVNASDVDWSSASAGEYTFSQASGGGNALGKIKFLFPNSYSVYLHDTPGRLMFDRDLRAFSHGCVRVDQPAKLAATIFNMTGDSGWTAEKVEKEIAKSSGGRAMQLKNKLPIYFYYVTAGLSEAGKVVFFNDVYGYDAKMIKALKL